MFFGSIGLRDIERELFKFAVALDDLDRGIVHQMLEPVCTAYVCF
jgi:hypothetical protein